MSECYWAHGKRIAKVSFISNRYFCVWKERSAHELYSLRPLIKVPSIQAQAVTIELK